MQNKVKKISDLIAVYSEKLQLFDQLNALDIYNSWSSIVGEEIAAHSTLVDINRHTAFIEVNHNGWYQQLLLNKRRIIQNFQKKYPQLGISSISVIVTAHYNKIMNDNIKRTKLSTYNCKKKKDDNRKTESIQKLPSELFDLFEKLKKTIIENEKF